MQTTDNSPQPSIALDWASIEYRQASKKFKEKNKVITAICVSDDFEECPQEAVRILLLI